MEGFLLFVFLFTASMTDLRYRRIDNLLNLLFFITGIGLRISEKGTYGAADSLMTAILSFAVLYVFYAARFLGAGDIKFIMALGAFIGSRALIESLVPITVFSAAVLMVFAVKERRIRDLKIPMAIPVSLGVLSGTVL